MPRGNLTADLASYPPVRPRLRKSATPDSPLTSKTIRSIGSAKTRWQAWITPEWINNRRAQARVDGREGETEQLAPRRRVPSIRSVSCAATAATCAQARSKASAGAGARAAHVPISRPPATRGRRRALLSTPGGSRSGERSRGSGKWQRAASLLLLVGVGLMMREAVMVAWRGVAWLAGRRRQ